MKTSLQIDITFEQILSLVRQLSKNQKILLSKELEKDTIDNRLTKLLKEFETQDLSLETIANEAKAVRQEIYVKQKS